MKKITAVFAIAIGIACSTNAFAANHLGQCVFPKTKVGAGGRLVMKAPINVADAPNAAASKRALTSMQAFTIKAQAPGGYVQLATVPDYDKPNPNQNGGRVVGWAKLSDFDFQDQRNCN
ncbi:hypothetical protein [Pandoraea soli]|uniref:Uncharacterized protein n=1 Tax=Pandoraea soli TaxID=2508293 RepID=A0ABY6W230_9BURK|nr:hypothetical protein [Pandoraea soli]VVE15936.1 hypothetical protein PSO31014_02866 [Pandoraea soli]